MSYQLFVPTFHTDECLAEIKVCLDKGWTGLGFKTVEFEEAWKAYTGFPHAHFLNSATAGLHLAVKILKEEYGWQDGDEIISTPLTFVSTNHVIKYENLQVRFADVDEHLCLDPEDVASKITPRTRAVLFVGHGGSTGRYEKIVALCKEKKLALIVDAAHMAGTRLYGEMPGKEADVLVYSFQAVKNLPTGDSGMVCFKEAKLDALAREYSWLGINKDTYKRTGSKGNYKWKYDVDHLGYKYNGNSIMAAIGLVQLRYLDQDNAYRRQIAAWYDEAFASCNRVWPIPVPEGCESSRHLYVIEVDDREALLQKLYEAEIYPGVHYRDNSEYVLYKEGENSCKFSLYMSNRIISLPLHLQLNKEDIDFIAGTIIKSLQQLVN